MTNDSLSWFIAAIITLGAVATIGSIYRGCGALDACNRSVGSRPCIPGTVEYDGDGECECQTQHGELEWDLPLGSGCTAY